MSKLLHRLQTVNDFYLFTDFLICITLIPEDNFGPVRYKAVPTEQHFLYETCLLYAGES
jgi:hypothetical protein